MTLRYAAAAAASLVFALPIGAQIVRDSAGIVIVENPAPDPNIVAFRVEATPQFRIVGDSSRTAPLLMTSLLRLPDGRFVTNDPNAAELRFHDQNGALIATAGGRGAAGGLLRGARDIQRGRVDSFYVNQGPGSPPLLFDGRGQFARNPFPAAPEFGRDLSNMVPPRVPAQLRGIFANGSLAAEGVPSAMNPTQTWRPMGDRIDPRPLNVFLHIDATGTKLLDSIGIFPGSDRVPTYTTPAPTGNSVIISPLTIRGLRRSSVVIDEDRFIYAEGTTYEIRVYSMAGRLQRIIRAAVAPRPRTDADVARISEAATRNLTGEALVSAQASLRGVMFPRTIAAFGRMMVDDAHRLWVEAAVAEGAQPYWSVFDRDGRLLGTVTMPDPRRIAWIGENQIAFTGVVNSRVGSEMVVHRLTK